MAPHTLDKSTFGSPPLRWYAIVMLRPGTPLSLRVADDGAAARHLRAINGDHKRPDYGSVIPVSMLLMNPLATCPVTSMRCSRFDSDAPNPPRSRPVQLVIRCARTRKASAVWTQRR